jgi:hypothetical protein
MLVKVEDGGILKAFVTGSLRCGHELRIEVAVLCRLA